jgi:hypothetical protein
MQDIVDAESRLFIGDVPRCQETYSESFPCVEIQVVADRPQQRALSQSNQVF